MTKDQIKSQYIIVLGTTYSGCGAIYDYLNNRGDLYEPLKGQEYELPQLVNGLMALEAASEKAFDPASAEFALSQFENTAFKLLKIWASNQKDENFSNDLKLFKDEIGKFIKEICAADFPMRLVWRSYNKSLTQRIIDKLKRVFVSEKIPQTRILVSQDKLVSAAQKMHDRMFHLGAKDRHILLNQAGSGWNPVESTKYFLNSKVVLVTRDPRDQFADLKLRKGAYSVEGFIDWYKEMQRRIKDISNPNILKLNFEEFVIENKKNVKILCNHTDLNPITFSSYQSELSKKNIGMYSEVLSKSDVDNIERHLSSYIKPFLKE